MSNYQPTYSALSKDWQDWITENLARACSPLDMANSMARSGQHSMAVAQAAIAEAMGQATTFVAPQDLPRIDIRHNKVAAPDRDVELLFVLKQPQVILLGNVLSVEECDAIIAQIGRAHV